MRTRLILAAAGAALIGAVVYARYNSPPSESDGMIADNSGLPGGFSYPAGGFPLAPQNILTDTGINSGMDNSAAAETNALDMGAVFDKLLDNNKILGMANIDMQAGVAKGDQQNTLLSTLTSGLKVNEVEKLNFNSDGTIGGVVKQSIASPSYYNNIVAGLSNKIKGVLNSMKPVEAKLTSNQIARSTVAAQLAATPSNKPGAIKILQNKLANLDTKIASDTTKLSNFQKQIDLYNTDKANFSANGGTVAIVH